jgi:hypothetical protein
LLSHPAPSGLSQRGWKMKVEMSPVTHGLATGAVLAVALYGASRLIEARDLLEVAIILPLLLICAPLAAIMTMDAVAAGVFKP